MRLTFGFIVAASVLIGRVPAQMGEAVSLRVERPHLLETAFQGFLENQQRWAYTQTNSTPRADGSPTPETVVRTDPSQPYDQQSVPLVINGQPPTEKQRLDWAKQSEKQAQRRLKAVEAQAAPDRDQGFRLRVLNREVRPWLDAATVIAEDDLSVTIVVGSKTKRITDYGGNAAPKWLADLETMIENVSGIAPWVGPASDRK